MFSPLRRNHPVSTPKASDQTEQALPGGGEAALNGARPVASAEFEAAVRRACEAAAAPLPPEMTTTQAAEFLDVSRRLVIKLIQRGELPCRLVGKRRRIPTSALLEQREKMFQRAKRAADEMSQIAQDLGLYD
jgi:excisionase family DNA binding protein